MSDTFYTEADVTITMRQIHCIGVGRFRILGGHGLEYWGRQGGPNSQQTHDVVIAVISTSCAHKVFNKSVSNNYISHPKI